MTFELTHSSPELRSELKILGAKLEYIEHGIWNVECNDDIVDDVVEICEKHGLKYRLV